MKKIQKSIKAFAVVLAIALITSLSSVAVFGQSSLPDPDQLGSVTVHKFSAASPSQTPGTGLELTSTEAAALGTPLAGVGFSLFRVNDSYTVTHTTTPAEALANSTIVEAEKLTGTAGTAAWTDLSIGYYVLSETTPPSGNYEPSPDAIITLPMGITTTGTGWNYNIHVYPKNVKTDEISKEVSDAQTYYNVGDTVSWKIDGKILGVLADNGSYGSMVITDVLDERLTYTDGSTVVTAIGGVESPNVLLADDYILTNANNTLTWSLTNTGMQKVTADGAGAISISFDTTINSKATDATPSGSVSITNGAELSWSNFDSSDTGTAEIDNTDKPTIALSGIVIEKVDSLDTSILLDGASFKIATSKANAENGTYIQNDAGEDIVLTTGINPADSSLSGWGMFTGLPLNAGADTDFFLVETKAPEGYVLRQSVIQVTVPDGSGAVTAQILNQKIGNPPLEEENPSFQLPQTGGMGTLLFTISGLVLITLAGVLIIVMAKKKKEQK